MTAKLSGDGLMMIRGERCLFRDLSFALQSGQMLLLEGQNGSGKTSLMRAIAGLLSLEEGDIFWNGESVLANRQAFHGSLAWLAHKTGLKGDLSMQDNLRFEASLRPRSSRDASAVAERVGIQSLSRLPVRSLSAGQQRRVALARLLLADVPLWLLDEPFTNLDKSGRDLVLRITTEHLEGGGIVVMAAHQEVSIPGDVQRIQL